MEWDSVERGVEEKLWRAESEKRVCRGCRGLDGPSTLWLGSSPKEAPGKPQPPNRGRAQTENPRSARPLKKALLGRNDVSPKCTSLPNMATAPLFWGSLDRTRTANINALQPKARINRHRVTTCTQSAGLGLGRLGNCRGSFTELFGFPVNLTSTSTSSVFDGWRAST